MSIIGRSASWEKDWIRREERYQGAHQGSELPVKCDIEYREWFTLEGGHLGWTESKAQLHSVMETEAQNATCRSPGITLPVTFDFSPVEPALEDSESMSFLALA